MNPPAANHADPYDPAAEAREQAAGMWLARRDRGLTTAEEKEFAAWLREDVRHQAVFEELETAFRSLDRAADLRPAAGTTADADLLVAPAPSRLRPALFPALAALGAAAAVAVGWMTFPTQPERAPEPAAPLAVRQHQPRQIALADGSVVELRAGARIETDFTPTERRVRIVEGEAHFTVAKNPARPFVVRAGAVEVRAVGTAFSVSQGDAEVEVLVTEGRVRVDDARKGDSLLAGRAAADPAGGGSAPLMAAGERVVIPVSDGIPRPAPVSAVSAEQLDHAMAWRSIWLEFAEMPLAEVVNQFNRHNTRRLRVADAATGRILVTGTFRVDGLDAFVRLLELNFGVQVTPTADARTLLLRTR